MAIEKVKVGSGNHGFVYYKTNCEKCKDEIRAHDEDSIKENLKLHKCKK